MADLLRKAAARLTIGILFTALLAPDVLPQASSALISWQHPVHEARVSALGQSTSALYNGTSYHANPAVPLENGVLTASSFLFSANPIVIPGVMTANLYSPSVSYSHGRFTYTALMDHTSYTLPSNIIGFDGNSVSNRLLRFQSGYRVNDTFSIGAGFSYSSHRSPVFGDNEFGGDAKAWGITLGAHYRNHFESGSFEFSPQAGISLNDLSNGYDFDTSTENMYQMPGQVRLGLGLDISSKQLRHNRPLFGGGVYTGFSKYLARAVVEENFSQVSAPSGFEALFTTWNSFERFTGTEMEVISLGRQISGSIGFEAHYLETFYLRYGIVGGADYWIRPQSGLGAELDLYYVSLAVTHLNFRDRWGDDGNTTSLQATFRLPIDGQSRDTLLGRLFNR